MSPDSAAASFTQGPSRMRGSALGVLTRGLGGVPEEWVTAQRISQGRTGCLGAHLLFT